MRLKDVTLPVVVLLMMYVAWGAAIPGPIGQTSQVLRSQINGFLTGLFSGFQTFNPYDRTEEAVEQLQR